MCKYCKNLKRIKDLNKKAQALIIWLKLEMFDPSDPVSREVLLHDVDEFLNELESEAKNV